MWLFAKFLGKVVVGSFFVILFLSACQPKAELVKPTAEQQEALDLLYNRCTPAASTTPSKKLKNLAKYRKPDLHFTCDEMKQLCENDYANDRCQGMITVASIENAFHKACRSSHKPSVCRKLSVCNVKGFESPECLSAIKPYNR